MSLEIFHCFFFVIIINFFYYFIPPIQSTSYDEADELELFRNAEAFYANISHN